MWIAACAIFPAAVRFARVTSTTHRKMRGQTGHEEPFHVPSAADDRGLRDADPSRSFAAANRYFFVNLN